MPAVYDTACARAHHDMPATRRFDAILTPLLLCRCVDMVLAYDDAMSFQLADAAAHYAIFHARVYAYFI